MQQPIRLPILRPLNIDRRNFRFFPQLDRKMNTDQLMCVVDHWLGFYLSLKISIAMKETRQGFLSNRNPRRIVRVFIREVRNLQKPNVSKFLCSSGEADHAQVIGRLQDRKSTRL